MEYNQLMVNERFKTAIAVNLLLRKDDKILLLKRADTGIQDGMYNVIAGHLESGELGTEAIIREAKEEANITIDPQDIRFAHFVQRLPQNSNEEEYIDIFYVTENWQGEIKNCEPSKCSEINWFSINNLPENTIPLLPIVIKLIIDNQNYSEYRIEPS